MLTLLQPLIVIGGCMEGKTHDKRTHRVLY